MATRGPFGRDISDMFNYSHAVRKAWNDIVMILVGFPHLGAVDRWLATPKRARIAH